MLVKRGKMYRFRGRTIVVLDIDEKIDYIDEDEVVGKTPPQIRVTICSDWDSYGPMPMLSVGRKVKLEEFEEEAEGPIGTPSFITEKI